jgi:hypothetical protein
MKPVERNSPNNGIGLTWDDGKLLTTSEGKAWWAGWEEGNEDGRADMEEELRGEIERLRDALRQIKEKQFQSYGLIDAVSIAAAALEEGKE